MQVNWELSQTLPSLDGLGVRAACVLSAAADGDAFSLVAGTQGGSLVSFGVPSGKRTPVPFRHNHAVTALLAFPDRSCYVTGCKDAVIRIFDAATHELQATLEGHDKPVTSLSWCSLSGELESTASLLLLFLVSGSWDGTAKVWDVTRRVLVATLADHENSVCCVGLTNSDTSNNLLFMATGSAGVAQNNRIAGHTVRLWSVDPVTGETNLLRKVANDHEGPIRGITLLPTVDSPLSLTLATCSNDGTVKLRSGDTAQCFATLRFVPEHQQHPPMLLAVTTINNNNDTTVAACAEDGHVVLWDIDGNSTKPPLLVTHANCVWNLVSLPNNDFATCCDDGHLRIFTRASERVAAQEERDTFVTQVAQAQQKAAGGPTPQEVAKLPRWETSALHSSEGQVHLFQKDGIAIAAQWSMASRTWIEVGQVMGSNNANTGVIDGVSYDHVLPVEMDQAAGAGVAYLQIGYNNGENPFVAAQRFIDAHMLPQYHLAQIADYIQQRVGGIRELGKYSNMHKVCNKSNQIRETAMSAHDTRTTMLCKVESILGVSELQLVGMPFKDREGFIKNVVDGNDNDALSDSNRVFVHRTTGQETPFGRFEVVTVAELRRRVQAMAETAEKHTPTEHHTNKKSCTPKLTTATGIDIGQLQGTLHTTDAAMVQVASNFNCLENASIRTTPNSGFLVDGASRDCTQGPAAAFGPLSAYLYRAHFHNGGQNDTEGSAVNLLQHVAPYFGVPVNGKLLLRGDEKAVGDNTAEEEEAMNAVVDQICIGLHSKCPIMFARDGSGRVVRNSSYHKLESDTKAGFQHGKPLPYPLVDQVFTASINPGHVGTISEACLLQYGGGDEKKALHHMARILLRAAYEATYLAAIVQGRRQLLLTLVGGGSFRNPIRIIVEEMKRAHQKWAGHAASKLEKCQICLYSLTDEQEVKKYLP